MQYKDNKGQVYEISYSQKLQKEQNQLLRQKNVLLTSLLLLMFVLSLGAVYLYVRLDAINFLTNLASAVRILAGA